MKIIFTRYRQATTLSTLAFVTMLAGCTMAPKHERPALPTAVVYPYETSAVSGAPGAADIGWRDFFDDPLLQELIEIALRNNRDLRKAGLNVEAARALYRIQRAEMLPNLSLSATLDASRTPADLRATDAPEMNRRYEATGTTTAWELDLWGRVQSLSDQALATYMALDETRIATQMSLVSEVASAWLTLRADRSLLRLTEDTLVAQRKSYALTAQLARTGNATQLDLRMAEIALRSAEINRAAYTRQLAQDRNALELLLGQPLTPELSRRLNEPATLTESTLPGTLPGGLPSELLIRRPDIRAAEHKLRSANARIGAARAAFFPTISLTGTAGTASASLNGLFEPGSGSWRFLPQITLPLFYGGALRADLDLTHVQKRIEIVRYEKTIQEAFREVADGLAGQNTLNDQVHSERRAVEASQIAYELAALRFQEGVDDYLTLLETHQMLYGAQQRLVRTRLMQQLNIIRLYKALGGGWREYSRERTG
ncbi:TPA: efflux transporter outer membrane subunit [Salmonella bongori]|uniref:RND efflux system outer membrane lipoproteinCmeC n=1 Tax=Salmonella bongori N268-08 TaxID=1197719 RepID=S5NB12_SALBN|nr:efflux transporter outer membrane subunit [Salmonella bongori]AGR57487.1 RND efflux system outer membrane lipoproteinCmeC [Salmonella bongori N268-08]ECE6545000.1 multidrug transporter [Salmonella bongori]ECI3516613.1 multidrug transporter [Salmonella bongori]EDP8576177.1 efflux transporter outer membrane subunit [Salmonella bongori]EDP8592704.1 efflux transporter outer membrane subunit [Salmonella bongori]